MNQLSKEQQSALRKAGRKFLLKMFFNGANYGGLIFMSNLILILANLSFFNSTPFLFVSVVVADIFFLNMMLTANKETVKSFNEQAKQIVASK